MINYFNYTYFGITSFKLNDVKDIPLGLTKKFPDKVDNTHLLAKINFKHTDSKNDKERADTSSTPITNSCTTFLQETEWYWNPDGDACNCNGDEYYLYSTYDYVTLCDTDPPATQISWWEPGGGGGGGCSYCAPDPCLDAMAKANAVTSLSQDLTYQVAQNNIIGAAGNDHLEHGVTFGRDANNDITTSPITTGSTSQGSINSNWPAGFADLHNHPNYQPPSPQDFYNLISVNNSHVGYNIRMVIPPDGSVYALVIINQPMANVFIGKYPSENIGYGPDFPEAINDLFIKVKNYAASQGADNLVAEEMAMAFIMDKYNTGISLLKQDDNGNFKRLQTSTTIMNGVRSYAQNNCP